MRKSTLFSVFLLLLVSAAQAQKGNWWVGGNVGFSSGREKLDENGTITNTYKSSDVSFSPEVGKFLTDHVQVGLAAVFGTSKAQSQTSNSYSKQTIFGATAYGRYFFGKEAFKPFAGVALSARPIKSKTYNGLVTERSKDFLVSAQINAGFGYAVSKRVTAVGSFGFLGYSHNTHTAPNETTKYKTSSFGMSAGSLGDRFNVGFYYTL